MAQTYDMSTLGDDRSNIKIQVLNETNNIDEIRQISISLEATLAELQFEVERTLGIKEEHQLKFKIDAIEMTSVERKLSGYGIDKHSTLTLYLSDDSDYTPSATGTNGNDAAVPLDNVVVQSGGSGATSGSGVVAQTANSQSVARPATDDPSVHFLTKHSKIQCRILLLVFVTFPLYFAFHIFHSLLR